MNAVLLINENDKVLICFKPLTDDEVLALDRLGLTVKGDVLSYLHLPLFAIRKGDLCYSFRGPEIWTPRDIDERAFNKGVAQEFPDNQPTGRSRVKTGFKNN